MNLRSYQSYLTITSICQALRISVHIWRPPHDFMGSDITAHVKHVSHQLPTGDLVTSRQLLRCIILRCVIPVVFLNYKVG